jgi:NAD(P)-dependent dehydrogenase (short-subunit alcohol dehydrogenase family)
MARVFVTGSADGLGLMAGQLLLEQGHRVVLHARNESRAQDAKKSAPGAEAVVVGDVSTIAQMRSVAEQVNKLGQFDAVIHNVALGYQELHRNETEDGLPRLFAVNVIAPYVLTALIHKPKRLVYMSSGMHRGAGPDLQDITWTQRRWQGGRVYAESKMLDLLLAFGVARRWPDVLSNAVEPGWVATKMGGPGATDDLDEGHRTQVWLAVSDEPAAKVTGQYFYHLKPKSFDRAAGDEKLQDEVMKICQRLSGVEWPA